MTWILRFLVNLVVIFGLSRILPGFMELSLTQAGLFVVVLGLLNWTIVPIVKILALPLNFLTLGLVGFIINGLAVSFTGYLVGANVSFWAALIVAFVLGLLSSAVESRQANAE